jgi:hypothetical protein
MKSVTRTPRVCLRWISLLWLSSISPFAQPAADVWAALFICIEHEMGANKHYYSDPVLEFALQKQLLDSISVVNNAVGFQTLDMTYIIRVKIL